jgi:hypothetical protein
MKNALLFAAAFLLIPAFASADEFGARFDGGGHSALGTQFHDVLAEAEPKDVIIEDESDLDALAAELQNIMPAAGEEEPAAADAETAPEIAE